MPLVDVLNDFWDQETKISIFVKFTIFLVAATLLYIFLRAPQKSSKYANIEDLIERYKNKVDQKKKTVENTPQLQGRILLKEHPVVTETEIRNRGVTPLRNFKLSSLLE